MVKFVVVLTLAASLLGMTPASAGPTAYSDVPPDHWAAKAISFVASDRDWMASADGTFRPVDLMTRRELARASVRAFAPQDQPDASRSFSDLPPTDPDWRAATIAVARGWLAVDEAGAFRPEDVVPRVDMDRALVLALGLTAEIDGLNAINARGVPLTHGPDFAVLVLADQLKMHYNRPSPNEAGELLPTTSVTRADGAYALWRGATVADWQRAELSRYRAITLPALSGTRKKVIEFAFGYVGWPYVWGGEWPTATAANYCCGPQVVGGFDCSGFVWWMLASAGGGWNPRPVRSYRGWPLPERSSSQMAKATTTRLTYEQTRPLDVLFTRTAGAQPASKTASTKEDWQAIDHVGVSLGNGWMIHSSGSRGGVTIDWVGDGWWRDRFQWARRIY